MRAGLFRGLLGSTDTSSYPHRDITKVPLFILSIGPDVGDKWIQIAMALATGAILVALTRLGEALKQLRTRIEILERPAPDPAAPAHEPPRRRPMLGAIMEEKPNPFVELARWPGGRAAMASGGFALVATLLALVSSSGRAARDTKEQLTTMAEKLDSVTALVGRLRDSTVTLVMSDTGAVASLPAKVVPIPPRAKPAPAAKARVVATRTESRPKLAPPPDLTAGPPLIPPAKVDSIR